MLLDPVGTRIVQILYIRRTKLTKWCSTIYNRRYRSVVRLDPAEYTAALSTLPDKVEAFDTRLAQGILRRELGLSKYQRLVPNANIQASIGQVYKMPLAQHGKSVVVKIQ
jgi:hypothetical protein